MRLGGAIGTAVLAVVLQRAGGHVHHGAALAGAFGTAYWWALGIAVLSLIPMVVLLRAERRARPGAPARRRRRGRGRGAGVGGGAIEPATGRRDRAGAAHPPIRLPRPRPRPRPGAAPGATAPMSMPAPTRASAPPPSWMRSARLQAHVPRAQPAARARHAPRRRRAEPRPVRAADRAGGARRAVGRRARRRRTAGGRHGHPDARPPRRLRACRARAARRRPARRALGAYAGRAGARSRPSATPGRHAGSRRLPGSDARDLRPRRGCSSASRRCSTTPRRPRGRLWRRRPQGPENPQRSPFYGRRIPLL